MKRLYTILAALLLSVTALYAQSWHGTWASPFRRKTAPI